MLNPHNLLPRYGQKLHFHPRKSLSLGYAIVELILVATPSELEIQEVGATHLSKKLLSRHRGSNLLHTVHFEACFIYGIIQSSGRYRSCKTGAMGQT